MREPMFSLHLCCYWFVFLMFFDCMNAKQLVFIAFPFRSLVNIHVLLCPSIIRESEGRSRELSGQSVAIVPAQSAQRVEADPT